MTSLSSRNGYSRLPTADPELLEGVGASGDYGGMQYGPHRDWNSTGLNPAGTGGGGDGGGGGGGGKRVIKKNGNQRPGLFHMFGDRGKHAANHISVALANQSESEQEGEHIELIEFRSRKPKIKRNRNRSNSKSPKFPKARSKFRFTVIEEPILPGDTIQRVSLRYNCPSSEIKRENNLYHDQDFFALKTVKIPVREYSILTEPQAREKCRRNNAEEPSHSSGGANSDDLRLGGPTSYYRSDEELDEECVLSSGDADDEEDSDSPEVRDVSIQSALRWKHSQHALLDKFDVELQKVRENTEQRLANLNEVAITMTTPTIQPIIKKHSYESSLLTFNTDWRVVLGVGGVIGIALIIVIVVYVTRYT